MILLNIIINKLKLKLLVFIDIVALIIFNYIYSNHFILSILLILFWIQISYLIGRYNNNDNNLEFKNRLFSSNLFKLFILSLITFNISLIIKSFFKSTHEYVPNQITTFEYIVLLIFFMFLIETISKPFIKNFKFKYNWLVNDKKSFNDFIKRSGLTELELINHNFIDIKDYRALKIIPNINLDGFIFDKIDLNDMKFIKINNKNIKKLETIDWIEKYINRLPVDLLINKKEDNKSNYIYKKKLLYKVKYNSEKLLSFLILLISLPVVLIASILIYLEDKGPILYKQKRTGIYGKPFYIYKLRSMNINAEEAGIKWSSINDKRVTKIGRFLRATRIDELPQLVSVINGDMSLIGPRPERPEYDRKLEKEIPLYNFRYLIKPGLSGWAQVSYPYGASFEDAKKKLSYDLFYIKNFSIILEFIILIKTIKLVINRQGSNPL